MIISTKNKIVMTRNIRIQKEFLLLFQPSSVKDFHINQNVSRTLYLIIEYILLILRRNSVLELIETKFKYLHSFQPFYPYILYKF